MRNNTAYTISSEKMCMEIYVLSFRVLVFTIPDLNILVKYFNFLYEFYTLIYEFQSFNTVNNATDADS